MSNTQIDDNVAPAGDHESPNQARLYDWVLGGTENHEVDRALGRHLESIVPSVRAYAAVNRDFLRRAVRTALDEGIRQFVDVGSGLPTMGSVHQVADACRLAGDSRVVAVDNDPVAYRHAARLLAEHGDPARHRAVPGDLLDFPTLWRTVLDTGLVDPAEPVCVLVVALLHFIKDESGLGGNLAYCRDQLAPGSLFVLSHSTEEGAEDSHIRGQAVEFHGERDPGQLRGTVELTALLGDFQVLDPGTVFAGLWRPDSETVDPFADSPALSHILTAVGRKPAMPVAKG